MRVLPKTSRRLIAGLLSAVAALVAAWVVFKPLEAHYQGRPSSYWAPRVVVLAKQVRYAFEGVPVGNVQVQVPVDDLIDQIFGVFSEARLQVGDPNFVPILNELLHHSDIEARLGAAEFLCIYGPESYDRAVPVLMEVVERHPDMVARKRAVRLLGENAYKDNGAAKTAGQVLQSALARETDENIRKELEGTLKILGIPER